MPSLIWKEWHEHSWKLAFGCLVLGALALIGLHARIIADAMMIMWICALGLFLLPILSSTGLIPAERSDGTLESLLALPVAPGRILAVKTALGLLLCAAPLIVACLISLAIAGNREMSASQIISNYASATAASLCLFMWMFALTVRLPTEARAALIAVGVLIIWLIASIGLSQFTDTPIGFAVSPFYLVYHLPYEVYNAKPAQPSRIIFAIVQLLIAAALWLWARRSFTPNSTAD